MGQSGAKSKGLNENFCLANGVLEEEELACSLSLVNSHLMSLAQPHLATDSFKGEDGRRLLAAFTVLVRERTRDQEVKSQFIDRIRKLEQQRSTVAAQCDRFARQRQQMEGLKDSILNRLRALQRSSEESLTKLAAEKEQYAKQVRSFKSKEAQFANELKKKQNSILQLKEVVVKKMGLAFCNEGPCQKPPSKDLALATQQIRATMATLTQQNTQLRAQLFRILKGLSQSLAVVGQGDQSLRGMLNQPVERLQNVVKTVDQAIRSLKGVRQVQAVGPAVDQKEVRAIISSYHQIIEHQDRLISRFIGQVEGLTDQHSVARYAEQGLAGEAKKLLQAQKQLLEKRQSEISAKQQKVMEAIRDLETQRLGLSTTRMSLAKEGERLRARVSEVRNCMQEEG